LKKNFPLPSTCLDTPGFKALTLPEELAQQGYATLLEKVLEELDFFTEPWLGSAHLGKI